MEDENIVVIEEDGKEYYFEELDRIELENGKKYIALFPIDDEELAADDDDGNVIILEVVEEDGKQFLVPIEDDKVYNEVGEIIEDRLIEKYADDEDVDVVTDDQ